MIEPDEEKPSGFVINEGDKIIGGILFFILVLGLWGMVQNGSNVMQWLQLQK